MKKVKLEILGLSYSQTQTGAYALVLAEKEGNRRIPIIIGGAEAQSIAIQLEGLVTPRPLTHDLFVSLASAFNIYLVEVNISKLEEGIFYSELICEDGKNRIKIDARTSDAVALALRFKCPIYTTTQILEKAGIILDFDEENKNKETIKNEDATTDQSQNSEFDKYNEEELNELLQESISEENYEQASLISDEIKRRGKQ